MKLMFVGNTRHKEPVDFPLCQAGRDLGYYTARHGHRILICSERQKTLDYWIMEGAKDYAQKERNRKVFVEVYYPAERNAPYQGQDFRLDNLIINRFPQKQLGKKAHPSQKGYSNLIPHIAMLDACDAVIVLAGGGNAFIDGHIAANRNTPVFVVRASGGSAQLLYENLQYTYDPAARSVLTDPWKKQSAERIIQLAEAQHRSVDVAIVCPLTKERKAVCAALGLTDANRISRGTQIYWFGHFGRRDWTDPAYEVVVAELAAMGNVNAAVTTGQVLTDWRPQAMLVVGIAAGVGAVRLGDVVIGSAVFYYEHGKVTPYGTKQEPYMYPADVLLYHKAITTGKWMGKIQARRPDGARTRPKVGYGVIASGEKVIADEAMRDDINRGQRKIAAIEMEAYGIAAAVWQHQRHVRQIAIRGICDTADSNKQDDWQEYAAAAAASFTRHYLLERPL